MCRFANILIWTLLITNYVSESCCYIYGPFGSDEDEGFTPDVDVHICFGCIVTSCNFINLLRFLLCDFVIWIFNCHGDCNNAKIYSYPVMMNCRLLYLVPGTQMLISVSSVAIAGLSYVCVSDVVFTW